MMKKSSTYDVLEICRTIGSRILPRYHDGKDAGIITIRFQRKHGDTEMTWAPELCRTIITTRYGYATVTGE